MPLIGLALFAGAFDGVDAHVVLLHAHEVVDGLGVVAAVDADGVDAHGGAVVGHGVAALEVGGEVLPVSVVGGVAFDDVVVDDPRLHAAAPAPDVEFPAVALHVDAGGEAQRADWHGAQGYGSARFCRACSSVRSPSLFPGFAEGGVRERLEQRLVAALGQVRGGFVLFGDGDPCGLGAQAVQTCTATCCGTGAAVVGSGCSGQVRQSRLSAVRNAPWWSSQMPVRLQIQTPACHTRR